LVHISQLADKFVKDPRTIVKTGDIVKVKVTEVDIKRKRIALTMKLNTEKLNTHTKNEKGIKKSGVDKKNIDTKINKRKHKSQSSGFKKQNNQATQTNNAMADALARAIN